MLTSESLDKIVPALLTAQKIIESVVKDKTGKITTKTGATYEYKYSDLASVLDEVKGPLNDNGILILQAPSSTKDGVTVTTRLLHESCQWIEESLYMPVTLNTPQGFGAAITYCRRYGLQSMVGLKAQDDDGKEHPKRPPKKLDAKQECVDAFEAMNDEQKDFLRSKGQEVTKLHENAGDLAAWWTAEKFDTEEQLAIWFVLDSGVRAAIKKANLAARESVRVAGLRNMAKVNPRLASQP